MAEVIALLAERREEIKAIGKLYRELSMSLGEETASFVLCEAIAAEAHASGKRAAPADFGDACLEHFAKVINARWADGANEGVSSITSGGQLVFEVDKCDYHALYRASDLPPEISLALSCGREEPFARGYDSRLILTSKNTPNGDDRSCRLVFTWNPGAGPAEKRPVRTLTVKNS